jgi:hypothetical protein
LPGLGVKGIDEPADAVFGAGDADDHLVFHDERGDGRGVADMVVGELDVEQDAAGLHVEREQVRIGGRHVEPLAQHAEAAVHRAAAQLQIVGRFLR